MTLVAIRDAVVSVGVLLLVVLGMAVLIQLTRLIANVNRMLAELDRELVPTLLKLQSTLDEVNTELDQIRGVVHAVEEVGDKVSKTARLAQELISSPLIKAAGFGAGARKVFDTLRGRETGHEEE